MKISSFFVLMFLLTALGAQLMGQTAVEYGTAASAAGATTKAKDIPRSSIGGVFDRVSKKLNKLPKGQQGHQAATAAHVTKSAASGKNKQPAASSAPKPEASRIVKPSQIQTGMSREELLSAVGKPYMAISGMDEGVFVETYMYRGEEDTVIVTMQGGKVTEISPMLKESVTAPTLATPPQTRNKVERPQ